MKLNGKNRPLISYPCEWQYKLIGLDYERVKIAAQQALAKRKHRLSVSNKSAKGRYTSFDLLVQVESDEDRTRIYEFFKAHPDIKMVL